MEPNHKHHHQPPFLTLLQKPSSMCRKEYHHNAGVFHPSDLVTFRRQQRRTVASLLPCNTQIPAILKKRQQKQQEVPPTNQECHPSSPSLPLTGVPNSSSPAIGSSALRQHQQECCPAVASMMSIISSLQEPLGKQQAERDKVTNDLRMSNEGFGDWIPPEILATLDADVAPKDNSPPPSPPQQQVKQFPRRSLNDLSPEKPQMRKGHWTHEEHRAFLEGMMLYPKQWKKIAFNFVRTRTATQVASHHQKFVLGLAGTGKRRGRRWPKKQVRRSSPDNNCITK